MDMNEPTPPRNPNLAYKRPNGENSWSVPVPKWWNKNRLKKIGRLPPGCYQLHTPSWGTIAEPVELSPELHSDFSADQLSVLAEFGTFAASRPLYEKHGFPHKRGLFLYGPPGCGKTSVIREISLRTVRQGGVVIFCNSDTGYMINELSSIRNPGEQYPILYVLEDLEGIIRGNDGIEKDLLDWLDGSRSTDGCFFLGTSNYPELTDKRLFQRPSRFDTIVKIPYPDRSFRERYLSKYFSEPEASSIAAQTEDLSVAHLKELVICHLLLGKPLDDTLEKLRRMHDESPTSAETGRIGF